MTETSGVDLSGKTVFTVVLGTGESGGGVAADRGRWPDERKSRSDDRCEGCVLVEDVGWRGRKERLSISGLHGPGVVRKIGGGREGSTQRCGGGG